MLRKKQNNEEQVDTHRWIISYADFITLLFAFFVVMYAISSVNISKYHSVSQGMHSAFVKKSTNHVEEAPSSKSNGNGVSQSHIATIKSGGNRDEMKAVEASLSDFADADYQVMRQDGWVEMDIKAGALFDLGSADLKPNALIKLMEVANVLKKTPYLISIEGYTDDVPISTSLFPSNWELSSARASAIARALNSYGVASDKLTVTGFSDQFPIANNHTEDGRAKNRRVNLIIARDRSIPRLMNPALSRPFH